MLFYPHFAIPNLFLANGFRLVESPYGETYEYDCEDALEDCIRRALVSLPKRLSGPDVRFLRRGMGLTQAALGELMDRDAQTVARIEKNSAPVPSCVDLTVRAVFIEKTAPQTAVAELVACIYDSSKSMPTRTVLTYLGNGRWMHAFEGLNVRVATSTTTQSTPAPLFVGTEYFEPSGLVLPVLHIEAAEVAFNKGLPATAQVIDQGWRTTTYLVSNSVALGLGTNVSLDDAYGTSILDEQFFEFREITSTHASRQ
jgi:DNA-binding XRE family transcriptional regulator